MSMKYAHSTKPNLFADAYKDNFVVMEGREKVRGKIIRPNIECTNGYIHLTDTVMIDDSPPWTVGAGAPDFNKPKLILTVAFSLILLLKAFL